MFVGSSWAGEKVKAFDSAKEYRRWLVLRRLAELGQITGLQLQKTFPLYGRGGTMIAKYKADFVYFVHGVRVVEDVKSKATKTRLYELKKKLMFDNYKITIKEI